MSGTLLTQAQCDRLRRLSEQYDMATAAELVGCDRSTVTNVKRRGWRAAPSRRPKRARPADFAIQAQHMTKKQLCAHYRAGDQVVIRWCAEIGRERMKPRRLGQAFPVPSVDELRAALAEHSVAETAALFGVHPNTLMKWRRAHGLAVGWSRQPRAAAVLRRDAERRAWAARFGSVDRMAA